MGKLAFRALSLLELRHLRGHEVTLDVAHAKVDAVLRADAQELALPVHARLLRRREPRVHLAVEPLGQSLLVAVAAHIGAHLNNSHLALPADRLPFFVHTLALLALALALVALDRSVFAPVKRCPTS